MAFTAAVEWDVWTTGSDTNGGGFAVGSGGTDRSQQAAAFKTYTDLVIDGTTNTDMTSAAQPFTSADIGNIVNITSGTGFTVQRVQIISIPSGVIARVDKSLGTLGSTGGNGKLGGALATPGTAGGLMVAGNTLHIKAGTYTITSASTNVAGGCVSLLAGGVTTPVQVIGYQTAHRDGGTRPLLQASGISTFSVITAASGNGTSVENVNVDGASLTSARGFSTVGLAYKCKAVNCTNSGFGGVLLAISCEATGCSTATAFSSTTAIGCVAYSNTFSGFGSVSQNCISANNSGASSHGFDTTNRCQNCTAYGNGGNGFNHTAGANLSGPWINCLSVGNAGWQFASSATDAIQRLIGCAAKADGSGAFDSDFTAANLINCVTLTADPFTNAEGGDFSLNNIAGAGASCQLAGLLGTFPGATTINTVGYQDIGAAQHRSVNTPYFINGRGITGQ